MTLFFLKQEFFSFFLLVKIIRRFLVHEKRNCHSHYKATRKCLIIIDLMLLPKNIAEMEHCYGRSSCLKCLALGSTRQA